MLIAISLALFLAIHASVLGQFNYYEHFPADLVIVLTVIYSVTFLGLLICVFVCSLSCHVYFFISLLDPSP